MNRNSLRCHFNSDGLQLAGIVEHPGTDTPHGSILFSHCFTCSKDLKAIVKISRELATLGWIVLRYDFRGLGMSQGDFSKSNFTTNCRDLAAASSFLSRSYPGPQYLMGHSFGGAASLATAQSLPNVLGVIAVAAPSDTHHLAALLERMNPNIMSEGRGQVTIGGMNYQIDSQMLNDFRSHDLLALLRDLAKPVLTFHSPVDETVAYEHALKICSLDSKPSQHRSLITLPNAPHLLPDTKHCVSIAQITNAWCLAH